MNKNKITLAAALLGAVAAPIAALAYLYRRPLPKANGTVKIAGLDSPVEIIRDRWGVPHIYAQNLDDLFFAQGYVHAQDRLWQMELNRRIGQGRLSEVIGELTFSTDRLLRLIGLARAAQNDWAHADAEVRRALESYALGVNTFIGTHLSRLPLEFTLLGFKPEAWRPVDSLAWGKMVAWGLSYNWEGEELRGEIVARLGAARAAKLHGEYAADNPIVLHDHKYSEALDQVREQFQAAREWLPLSGTSGMSNNWVVDGSKSLTGQPLLANDPHLALQMPSIWYENHLYSAQDRGAGQDFEATGVSVPGAPGVLIGHNREIAWGMTAAFADTQDLYLEKFHPDDPTQYEFQGAWEKATVVREEIRVKGEAGPRVMDITLTRHGPVINPWMPPPLTSHPPDKGGASIGVALRWTGHEPSRALYAVLGIDRAHNWDEFTTALKDWTEPSLSFVYADRAGNIGFYMSGKIPIRARGQGLTPVPGWTGEHEWTGWLPHEELPHGFNPPQHFFATSNNRIAGKEYPHFLTSETMNGMRARRVVELLTQKERLGAEDFARIQVDEYCAPARSFCELAVALAPQILGQAVLRDCTILAERALNELANWDYHLTAESAPGAVYELMQHFAMRRVFTPWLGDLTEQFIGVGYHPLLAPILSTYHDRSYLILQRMLTGDEREWFKDAEEKPLAREQILALALSDALAFLQETCGGDAGKWQWGRLHKAWFNHPLGAQKPLDKIFNRGPFPYGGDTSTVWQAAFVPKFPIPPDFCGTASWRQIIDVGDWDASRVIHTTGQSGHPSSKHYDDMIPLWLQGEYHPMLWSRDRVEAEAEARLRMEP